MFLSLSFSLFSPLKKKKKNLKKIFFKWQGPPPTVHVCKTGLTEANLRAHCESWDPPVGRWFSASLSLSLRGHGHTWDSSGCHTGMPRASTGWRPGVLLTSCNSQDGPHRESPSTTPRGRPCHRLQSEGQIQGLLATLTAPGAQARRLGRRPGGDPGVGVGTHLCTDTQAH